MLIDEKQRRQAELEYPDLFFALQHEQLQIDFRRFDAAGRALKTRVRALGLFVIGMTFFSFVIALTEPAFGLSGAVLGLSGAILTGLAVIGLFAGTAAIFIGNVGVLTGKAKRAWLQNRLVTERLRQWNYQYMIAHAADLARAAESEEGKAGWLRQREIAYGRLQTSFIDQIDAEYSSYIAINPATPYDVLLNDDMPGPPVWLEPSWKKKIAQVGTVPDSPAVEQLLDAYYRLRILGQLQYNRHKLEEEGKFWVHPRVQARRLKFLSSSTIVIGLASNALALTFILAGVTGLFPIAAGVLAVLSLLSSVCIKAVEEGLQPEREIQRTVDYQRRVEAVEKTFATSGDVGERLRAAIHLEETSFLEMVDFLYTNARARFVV